MAAGHEHEALNAALRARIVKAARRHASTTDAEDRAQEVLLRLIQEVARPDAPVLEARALAKLKDVEVDAYRKQDRHRSLAEKAANATATNSSTAMSQDAHRLIEIGDQIRELVGRDALAFALLKTYFKATEADVAAYLGWPPQRAAAARVRLARKRGAVIRLLRGEEEA